MGCSTYFRRGRPSSATCVVFVESEAFILGAAGGEHGDPEMGVDGVLPPDQETCVETSSSVGGSG